MLRRFLVTESTEGHQLLQLCYCKITKLSHSNIQCSTYHRPEAQRNAPTSLYRRANYMIRLILGLQKIIVAELDTANRYSWSSTEEKTLLKKQRNPHSISNTRF